MQAIFFIVYNIQLSASSGVTDTTYFLPNFVMASFYYDDTLTTTTVQRNRFTCIDTPQLVASTPAQLPARDARDNLSDLSVCMKLECVRSLKTCFGEAWQSCTW